MYKFSNKSIDKINSCDERLQDLIHEVLSLQLFDFAVIHGYRGEDEQNDLVAKGYSKLKYPNSKHNKKPSQAFDFMLYLNGQAELNKKESYYMAVGVFRAIAAKNGLKIRVGADWDGDFDTKDQTFNDLMHIELL